MKNTGSSWLPFILVTTLLAVLFAAIAQKYRAQYSLPFPSACSIYVCFVLPLVLAIAPGFAAVRRVAAQWIAGRYQAWQLIALWCLPYFLFVTGTGDWRWTALARLLGVALPVLGIYTLFPVRDESRFVLQDAAVAILLVAAVLSHALHEIWSVPVNLDFLTRLYLVTIAAWTWTFIRPVPHLGYEFRICGRTLRAAALNFCWFALIAIPGGFLLKFTAWNPRWRGLGVFLLDFIEIFLFIALLEEMFFRGFLQSLLSRTLGSWWRAQAAVALLFGLFHILHAPFPNWKYVLLATVAGWFYGSAFRNGSGLMASALMHATVDTVWRTFLTR